MHSGVRDWVVLAAGDAVSLGDELRTLVASKLNVLFRDDSVLVLAASSRLIVDEQLIEAVGGVSLFSLAIGTVRALISERYQEPGARFELRTPTAVVGVRGTGFIVSYDPANKETLVAGLFGATQVWSTVDQRAGREVLLGPRQFTVVGYGELPTQPVFIDAQLLQTLMLATELRSGGHQPEEELSPEAGAAAAQEPLPRPGAASKQAAAEESHLPMLDPSEVQPPGQPALLPEALQPTGRSVVDQPIPALEQATIPEDRVKPPPPPP